MSKEIKILLPDSSADEVYDIEIQASGKENIGRYRFETWDLVKDNPNNLAAADFLRQKIKSYEDLWIVAEIYAEENKKIPILLRRKETN